MGADAVVMAAMVGADSFRDLVKVLDGLERLQRRGAISAELQEAFMESLAEDLAMKHIANDALPSAATREEGAEHG